MTITTEQQARAAGYTQAVLAESSQHVLELLVRPGTDFDGWFAAFDVAEGELLTVCGWLFSIDVEECAA